VSCELVEQPNNVSSDTLNDTLNKSRLFFPNVKNLLLRLFYTVDHLMPRLININTNI
jgi:hypothetical protein